MSDFIVLVDDGGGWEDPSHVVVETKGCHLEDDVGKQNAIRFSGCPALTRWAFIELTRVWETKEEFERLTEQSCR